MSETITTIIIKTYNGNITDVQATPTPVEDKAFDNKALKTKQNKKKKHGNRDNYAVRNMNLLNKVIDAGFIKFLHGIQVESDNSKSYHFDKVPKVKAIIDTYFKAEENA